MAQEISKLTGGDLFGAKKDFDRIRNEVVQREGRLQVGQDAERFTHLSNLIRDSFKTGTKFNLNAGGRGFENLRILGAASPTFDTRQFKPGENIPAIEFLEGIPFILEQITDWAKSAKKEIVFEQFTDSLNFLSQALENVTNRALRVADTTEVLARGFDQLVESGGEFPRVLAPPDELTSFCKIR